MIVYAVYVVTESGNTVVEEFFQSVDDIPDGTLMGGLITALQTFSAQIHRSEMKTIEIEGLSYHIRSFGLYRIVLVTNLPTTPEDIIQTLGLRFMKEYGEILLEQQHNLTVYSPFKRTIRELMTELMISDESGSIKPTKKLNTGEIFSLPHHLQSTALAMISLLEGTVEEIALEIEAEISVTEENLQSLNEMGFVGKKQKDGKTIYFCST
ncbi:MAG: hypothetical protein ACFFBD_24720 [Candidatus Hodarchaeota archaeon]